MKRCTLSYGWSNKNHRVIEGEAVVLFVLLGTLGILWFIVWLFVVFDNPSSHPRISYAEKKYIESNLKCEGEEKASWLSSHITHTFGQYKIF